MTDGQQKNIENIYPLSPMQQGLLFQCLLANNNEAYIPQIVLTLRGEIDSAMLGQAWQRSIDRYAVLRSGIFWEERDDPFQVVYQGVSASFVPLEWSNDTLASSSERLGAFLVANRQTGFDLRRPPLIRAHLISLADQVSYFVICYH
ncbi:MAG: condensation domain-containing protein, partial [Pseudomonadota bacterium]